MGDPLFHPVDTDLFCDLEKAVRFLPQEDGVIFGGSTDKTEAVFLSVNAAMAIYFERKKL